MSRVIGRWPWITEAGADLGILIGGGDLENSESITATLFATPFLQISLLPVSLFHSLYLNDYYLISQTTRHNLTFLGSPGGG